MEGWVVVVVVMAAVVVMVVIFVVPKLYSNGRRDFFFPNSKTILLSFFISYLFIYAKNKNVKCTYAGVFFSFFSFSFFFFDINK